MAGYGISDAGSLMRATTIASRAALGYGAVAAVCIIAVDNGYDLRLPGVFAMMLFYVFAGIGLIVAGRRRLIVPRMFQGAVPRIMGTVMALMGSLLLFLGTSSLLWIAGILLLY